MDARGRARAGGRRARRGLDRAAHADGQRGPRPDQRHGRHARDAAARPPRPRATAEGRGRDRGDVDGGPAWHRPRLRGRPHRDAPPARSAAKRGQPHPSARRLGHRREPPLRRPARAGRVLAALRSAGQRRRARHLRLRAERGRRGAESGDRQPGGDARRARGVVRELPRRTGGAGLRLPGDRRRRAGRDRGAPHGPHARPEPLIRAAAVPRRGRRGQLRADARPLHAGRDGRREPQAVRAREHRTRCPRARCRRTTCRWAGPRPASSAPCSRTSGASWRWSLTCAARALDLRAPLEPAAGTGAARASVRGIVPGPGPDRWLAPELGAAEELVASNALLEAVESAIGSLE